VLVRQLLSVQARHNSPLPNLRGLFLNALASSQI
jgi:hypothetical protein